MLYFMGLEPCLHFIQLCHCAEVNSVEGGSIANFVHAT